MKKTEAVLFDMDGVLIDSFEAWFSVFNSALGHYGFKQITKHEFIQNCWAIDSAIVIPKYFSGKSISAVIGYYFSHFLEFKGKVRLLPESKYVLKELKDSGLKMAVVTNTYHKQTDMMLKAIGLFDFFDAVVCADDVKLGKPEPDMLLKACEEIGIEKERAVFVGDTLPDILAGKNAGMFTIGLNIDGGDRRIQNLKELLPIIDRG